nr:MAG TPA: hypothetical protein [Caudoviricetes sp.]
MTWPVRSNRCHGITTQHHSREENPMAKITLHVTPLDAAELAEITAALAPFVSSSATAAAETPTPAAAEEAPKPKPKPKPKRRASRKAKPAEEPKAEEPAPVPPTEPSPSTEQTSGGELGSREALLDAMRSALKAGKRAEVAQVLQEFGAARVTELKDEDVAAATAMVVAL